MKICWMFGVALGLALGLPGQAPPAGAEAASAKSVVGMYNDPATTPAALDAVIDNFLSEFPVSTSRLGVLVLGVRYHRAHDEFLQELRYGVAALQVDPNDLYVLSSLGMAIPQNVKDSDLNRDQMIEQANGYDQKLIGDCDLWQITPAGLNYGGHHFTQAQAQQMRDNLEGPAYLSLGQIATLHQQLPAAVTAYQKALPFMPDPARQAEVYYDLGVAEAAQQHVPEARAAFAKTRQLGANSQLLLQLVAAAEAKLGAQP